MNGLGGAQAVGRGKARKPAGTLAFLTPAGRGEGDDGPHRHVGPGSREPDAAAAVRGYAQGSSWVGRKEKGPGGVISLEETLGAVG